MKEKLIHYGIKFALYCMESPKIRTVLLTTILRGVNYKKLAETLKNKDKQK